MAPTLPTTGSLNLRAATIPACVIEGAPVGPEDGDGLVQADLVIRDGRIAAIAPSRTIDGIDLNEAMILPGFVDLHTHLDKGHIWPRAANRDGTFMGAFQASMADRERRWSADDIERRVEFGLRCALAHGTVAIRTHLDSPPEQYATTWDVFDRVRARWAGRIELQAASITGIERFDTPFGAVLAERVARSGGVLGAVTTRGVGDDGFQRQIDRMFDLAAERGLDLDLHVDESGDQAARALPAIARAAIAKRFKGRIVCGHCCSLAVQQDEAIAETLALVREAGIAIVSLPMCNLFLQDRVGGRTPRWRGVTLLHELAGQGTPVAVASDNCRDPFYGYGDHDMLEVFREATRIAHLDRPFGAWPRAVTATPAALMGLAAGSIRPGASADLVLFAARRFSELLARHQADRVVLRAGKPSTARLPDYAELDDLMERRV